MMSKIQRLLHAYTTFVDIPWEEDAAPAQRVIFCVYPEEDELRLRASIEEFELATRQTGHNWLPFDLTDTFPAWLAGQKHAENYYKRPERLIMPPPAYETYLEESFAGRLEAARADRNTVVALMGVGSLFGILKVKQMVDDFAPLVPGRLLVFFPGTYENQNYRLLDGYDGWNYLAVPITTEQT